jgi:molybdenum cofactor cytidylyltransferase
MISHVLRESLASQLDHVIVVLGPPGVTHATSKVQAFSNSRVSTIVNPCPGAGMSESIRVGLGRVDPLSAGAALILGDQPLLTARVIDTLIDAFRSNCEKIVAPLIHGRRSTPAIFPASLFPEIMQITGDVGARNVLKRHWENVVGLEMSALYDDTDLDTEDDLVKIREQLSDRKSCL